MEYKELDLDQHDYYGLDGQIGEYFEDSEYYESFEDYFRKPFNDRHYDEVEHHE